MGESEHLIHSVQEQIDRLIADIERAKADVQSWVDTSARLSQSATEARAKNQGMGRGLGGALLGAKYRSAMRRAASSSNAAIAKDVAEKKAQIADGKRRAQENVKALQARLADAKARLKELSAERKSREKESAKAAKATQTSAKSLGLLEKLKEAHELGLLTDQEYEEKRRKLVAQI